MNTLRATALALAMSIGLVCQGAASSPSVTVNSDNTVEGSEDALISRLRPVLLAAHTAGRVYFGTTCTSQEDVSFPNIKLAEATGRKTDVEAISDMLEANRDVKVTGGEHIVRIRIGRVPRIILQARISLLALAPEEQYNSGPAIGAIEGAPEVQRLLRLYGITTPIVVFDYLLNPPDKKLPHLPPALVNVTVDQALDLVAKTFGKIVFYGHCSRPRRYYIKDFPIVVDGSPYDPWGVDTPK